MIKPDRGLCLSIESLMAFYIGCAPWIPKEYDFYDRVFK